MKIGIIGLGLIGGSILKALQGKGHKLFAVSKSSYAEAAELAEAGVDTELVRDCDLVFVCSEMSKTISVLDSLEGLVRPDAIVCDVASLKGFVANKERSYNFIGTHPMAGTEFSGFGASDGALFEGAKWVVTEKNTMLEEVIGQMGATPVFCNADEHDYAAALISHLPMLVSFALVGNMEENNLAKTLASSGFRDTTRLALTNSTLAVDMLNLNEENINRALDGLILKFSYLKNLCGSEKIEELKRLSSLREKMYDENGKNIC